MRHVLSLLFGCVLCACSEDASSTLDAGSQPRDTAADACMPYECFGAFSCADGQVTEWVAGEIPCGQPGFCRSNDYVASADAAPMA